MNESITFINNLASLVYGSRSALPRAGREWLVKDIVDCAILRNSDLGITGALVYTELHFAQILEGPASSLTLLMSTIRRDNRHRDIRILSENRIASRTFAGWSMAYAGPSPYLDRHIKRLLGPFRCKADHLKLCDQLIAEMLRLSEKGTTSPGEMTR